MIVTDLKISIPRYLIKKMNLMVSRMGDKVKGDCLILLEGSPGSGKSNLSIILAKYISHKTGRPFSNSNIFFDVDKMIEFAQNTEKQIFVWDEPALSGLSNEWYSKSQRDLVKLLMLCRKKRHAMIFNLTNFYKFNPYIIERAVAMIRMYSKDGIKLGRWAYYKINGIEKLAFDWKSKRKKSYKKYYSRNGTIGFHMFKIIDEKAYEKEKELAIRSIGGDKKVVTESKTDGTLWIKMFMKNWIDNGLKISQNDLATLFGRERKAISRYKTQLSPNSS